jgi:hypothetical protein
MCNVCAGVPKTFAMMPASQRRRYSWCLMDPAALVHNLYSIFRVTEVEIEVPQARVCRGSVEAGLRAFGAAMPDCKARELILIS